MGDGTRVDLAHSGIEKMGEQAHGLSTGWDEVLSFFVQAAS